MQECYSMCAGMTNLGFTGSVNTLKLHAKLCNTGDLRQFPEYHQLGDLNNRNVLPHSSGG